jgi:hypothetical protein
VRRRRRLTFVFVGGGYAGVETLAELHDLVQDAPGSIRGWCTPNSGGCCSTQHRRSWPRSRGASALMPPRTCEESASTSARRPPCTRCETDGSCSPTGASSRRRRSCGPPASRPTRRCPPSACRSTSGAGSACVPRSRSRAMTTSGRWAIAPPFPTWQRQIGWTPQPAGGWDSVEGEPIAPVQR